MDEQLDNTPTAGGMKLAHLNVGSILGASKFEMLRKQVEESKLSVFCASETWLNKDIPDRLVSINGYNHARVDRMWSDNPGNVGIKRGGGLICYVDNGIDMNEFSYAHLNNSSRDVEMQWVALDIKNMRKVVIVNIYRPPQGDYKAACKIIHNAINNANLKDNAEIFLMGDFNINMLDKKSPVVKELETTTSFWGLKAFITGRTRFGSSGEVIKGSCIDNIFSNSEIITEAKILDWNFSDHLAVMVRRKRAKNTRSKVAFKGRSYKNYVREDLQGALLDEDWNQFYEANSPSTCWDILEGKIKSYLDTTCPQKMFKVNETRDPWVTNEVLEEIKDKDSLLRIARRSGKPEDWREAKLARNRVGRLVEVVKADFLKEQQVELADDPKKFWRLVKTIIPGKKVGKNKITLIDRDKGLEGEKVDEDQTADFVNSFFSGIGPKLAVNHNEPWEFFGENPAGLGADRTECPNFTTEYGEVLKLCKDIKISKSSGFEDISTKVFKDAFRVLVPQLVYLFNLSFRECVFPDRWKQATIVPLHKGGDKTEVGNYRPVSLLPLPGKLIERVVHGKMSAFLEAHGLITDKQGGFRKGFSTASIIVDITNSLFNNINNGLTSLAAFVDLRKAFDTVNHGILERKLKCYGINGSNLRWCENYLTGRTQKSLVNGVRSSSREITCGVPQGSVLGPLFFILYVNDLQHAVMDSEVQLYADDTVIFTSGVTPEEAEHKLQPSLDVFSHWCHVNKLSINAGKTKLMVFGTRHKVKKAKKVRLNLEGAPLQIVPTYKYLGFTLDSTLSFNYQVKCIANMVSYKASVLSKIRKFLKEDVALKIYKSMILPYFDYGDVIYMSANQEGLDKLQRLQNRCLKICKNLNVRFEARELHVITKVPKLEFRREAHMNNFMHGRLNRLDLVDQRDIRTRLHDAPTFLTKIPNLEAYKRAVEYSGAVAWNKLPPHMREIESSAVFKNRQKDILLRKINQ